jgi:hypothetical protein
MAVSASFSCAAELSGTAGKVSAAFTIDPRHRLQEGMSA